ncbi:serine/threonine-protein kinase SIK2-like [Tachypleus tridentatus]|uniref:serine/threonine-protein kinase SIK2-like n=1 Tax=Tachypleus tridentatus TaxID=6853 RepID=UPI003FD3EE2A
MDRGDLRNYVNSQKFLTEIEARRIFRQLVDATDACHCQGVCHRDIKLDNIFVDENENIKLGDFGFAAVGGDLHRLREHRGSYVYTAPEVLNQQEYDGFQADIWSLGVCLYAMVCGRLPFTTRQDPQEFLEAVSLKVIFTKKVTKACRDIIRRMLNPDPEKRPTLKDIRRSNWFSQPFNLPTTDRLSLKPFRQFTPPIIGAEHGYFQDQKYHREPSLNYVTSFLTYVAKQARSKIRTDIKSTKPLSEIYGIKGPVCQRIVEKLKEKEAAKSKRRSLLSLPTEEIDNSVIEKRRENVARDLRALRYSTGGRIAQLARKEHRRLMAQTKIRNESRIQKGFRWKLLVSKIKQERIEKWCRLCVLLLAQAEAVKENKS